MKIPPRAVVVVAVAFSSLSALLIRMSTAPPIVIAAWRMIFAAVMAAPVAVYRHRRRRLNGRGSVAERNAVQFGGAHPDGDRHFTPGRVPLMLAAAGAFLAVHFATWITSLSFTSVSHSTLLVTMHPMLVTVAGFLFLGEAVNRRRIGAVLLSLVGAVVLTLGGSSSGRAPSLFGDVLAFGGAVAISGYLVIGRWARRTVSTWTYSAVVYGVAAAILAVTGAALGLPLLGYGVRNVMIFLALALFCTILGHSLINWGLRYVPVGEVSMMILLEPVFATITAVLFLNEVPGVVTVAGGLIVLLSLTVVSRSERASIPD